MKLPHLGKRNLVRERKGYLARIMRITRRYKRRQRINAALDRDPRALEWMRWCDEAQG